MEKIEIVQNLRQQIGWCGDSPADRSIKHQCEERIRELLGETRSERRSGAEQYPSSDDAAWRQHALRQLQSAGIDCDIFGNGLDDGDMPLDVNDEGFRSMIGCKECRSKVRAVMNQHRLAHN